MGSTLTELVEEGGRTMKKDKHHIFYCRHDYNKGWAKTLRAHWYCTVEIPRDTLHKRLHRELERVPVPTACNIQSALFQLDLLKRAGAIHSYDNIERRLMVLMALFDCCEPKTYEALEKQYEIVRKFYKKTPSK